nr:hypothetical protein [Lactiplantibacillus plantarum]
MGEIVKRQGELKEEKNRKNKELKGAKINSKIKSSRGEEYEREV